MGATRRLISAVGNFSWMGISYREIFGLVMAGSELEGCFRCTIAGDKQGKKVFHPVEGNTCLKTQ